MPIHRKIFNVLLKIRIVICNVINKVMFNLEGCTYGKGFSSKGLIFIKNSTGKIVIGNNVRINSSHWSNPIGIGFKTYFQIIGTGQLIIDDNCGISNSAFTCAKKIYVGKNVYIGSGCKIYDTDFHPINPNDRFGQCKNSAATVTKEIVINDGAFIGGGSFILKGTIIGENSVIGAGSVVSGSVPANQIWGGNPAKYIKDVTM